MVSSPAPSAAVRGGGLDLLRFSASLFVVLFHFGDEAPVPLRDLHDIWGRGYLATDFFLMLSGFVLARAYGRALNAGQIRPLNFWLKRFARSYPTHLITLGLLILMVLGANLIGKPPSHPEHFPLNGIPAQILLLHVFGLGGGEWNIPAWTLSALLICYVFMPWLWRAFSKMEGVLLPLGLGLTLLLAGQTISLSLLDVSIFQLPYHLALVRAFPLFLVGLLLARTVETGHWTPVRSHMMVAAGAGILFVDIISHGPDTLSLLAIAMLTLGCGSYVVTKPIPGAAWGAKVSFSLFMTHTLVGALGFAAIRPIAQGLYPPLAGGILAWLFWLSMLAAALVAAELYNRLIDAPLQKWIRHRWFSHNAASPVSGHPDQYQAAIPNGSAPPLK
jgi:peptidoglycan/LPS O-acetylase OafA/YrhL